VNTLLLAFAAAFAVAGAAKADPVDLKAYADANGNLGVQKLTCKPWAGTFQEDADFIEASTDQKITLWVTLSVTTLMVAVTAYVLSFALLGPADNPPPHRSAAAFLHARS
jgi:hypothetical protein